MRILYFTRGYTPHDRRFLTALAGTEHQIFFLQLEKQAYTLEDRPVPPEVEIIPWAGGKEALRRVDYPRLEKDLKRVIRQYQPDLIHAGPIQTSALLAARTGFHPLVSMSWGSDLLKDAESSPWNLEATRYTLSRTDVLVGDCLPVHQKAIEFGMPDERIVIFPWGVDLKHFSPLPENYRPEDVLYPRSQQVFTLLSVRSWEPLYGVDVIARAFIQAAQELRARGGPELRLLLAGTGSQASLLRKIFMQGGVMEQVIFTGQVSYANLPRCYRSADLYLSASHSDGTSISLLEAMACGCPVLVSDIPGNRPWVEPGVQGWLFPDGDSTALAQAILRAIELRERLPEMGCAARRLAEERADWPRNFQKLLHAYELALRLGGHPAHAGI